MQMECCTVSASESAIPKLPQFYSLVKNINVFLAEIMWHVLYSLFFSFFPVMLSNHMLLLSSRYTVFFCIVELKLCWHLEFVKTNFSVNSLKKFFFNLRNLFYYIHANIVFLTLQVFSSL